MEHVWKEINGYHSYMVSNYGEIVSLCRNKKIILKQRTTKSGYKRVNLYSNNICKTFFTHTIVANAFIFNENPKIKLTVNHIDGNKLNNNAYNLEWISFEDNLKHAHLNGLMKYGESHGMCKLTNDDIIKIRHLYLNENERIINLSKKFNISYNYTYKIVNNKTRIL